MEISNMENNTESSAPLPPPAPVQPSPPCLSDAPINIEPENTVASAAVAVENGRGVTRVTLDSSGDAPAERCMLEDFTRCSTSHLWKLMMSFYDRKGIESWSQGVVPHFITCNSFIGKSYAKVT
jgi:hypothetical protein